jgi:hypothetical protein
MKMAWNELAIKYRRKFNNRRGGIFRSSSRDRLLGITKSYGGRYANNILINFTNRITEYVKTALLDLELFVETMEKSKVSKAINAETVSPFLNTYFQIGKRDLTEKDYVKAEVARLMIQSAFEYLSWPNIELKPIPDYEKKIVDNALDLSNNLAIRMKHSIAKLSK